MCLSFYNWSDKQIIPKISMIELSNNSFISCSEFNITSSFIFTSLLNEHFVTLIHAVRSGVALIGEECLRNILQPCHLIRRSSCLLGSLHFLLRSSSFPHKVFRNAIRKFLSSTKSSLETLSQVQNNVYCFEKTLRKLWTAFRSFWDSFATTLKLLDNLCIFCLHTPFILYFEKY